MEKREYGTGQLREKRPGVWTLRWYIGRDPVTGRNRLQQETFHGTKTAAQKRLQLRLGVAHGTAPTSATLGDLLDTWEKGAKVKPETMARYGYALRHLPPAMRATPIGKIDPPMILRLYDVLDGEVGRQSIRKMQTALSSAFTFARGLGWITDNPVRGTRAPKISDRAYSTPDADAIRRMFALADAVSGACGVWMRLAVATGARRGEVLALRWRDLDMTKRRLSISSSLRHDLRRGDTKTEGSVRTITIDADTIGHLAGWQARAEERAKAIRSTLGPDCYIVSDDPRSRVPWRPELASKRAKRIAKAAGLSGVRLHDMRHAHATMLIESGVSPRTVAERLGHTKVSTTTDIYGHLLTGADDAAADAFGRAMGS